MRVHEEYPDNTCVVIENKTDGVDEAFAKADVVVKQVFRNQRLIPTPIEPRGVVAHWIPSSDELTVYTSTQIPHFVRTFLAICCNVSEAKVRVVAPDVGGGFGSKLNCYAEEFIAAAVSRKVGAPVKWIEERSESMTATIHGRAQDAHMEIAATREGKVLGLRAHYVQDCGSYLQLLTPTMLNTGVLRCMPLDSAKFRDDSMFAPLFAAVKQALYEEPLLPRYETGYAPGASARLARTQELRELFTPQQLASLSGEQEELAWLSPDITQDRTAELRRYLMQELDVAEVTPETIVPRLDKPFLETQPDEWLLELSPFPQRATGVAPPLQRIAPHPLARRNSRRLASRRTPSSVPAGRGQDGISHGQAIRLRNRCSARIFAFVESDRTRSCGRCSRQCPADLPGGAISVSDEEYEADIKRILAAFATDSKVRRDRLVAALSETAFLQVRDAGNGKWFAKPSLAYLATERLKGLFAGIKEDLSRRRHLCLPSR